MSASNPIWHLVLGPNYRYYWGMNVDYARVKVVVFDIDGTLTQSKSEIFETTSRLLCSLLDRCDVAIISGAGLEQYKKQILDFLNCRDLFSHLHLFPTNGASYLKWNGHDWEYVYREIFSESEKEKIRAAICDIEKKHADIFDDSPSGPRLEDRGSAMTFSVLGQDADYDKKQLWDPEGSRRAILAAELSRHLSEFEVRIGGTTSLDITRRGVDKAYAIRKIQNYLGVLHDEVLYVGDSFGEFGNDKPVESMGIRVEKVLGPHETERLIETIINSSK